MGDGVEGFVEVKVEVVEVGVNREIGDHGVDVVGGPVVGDATVLRVDKYVVVGGIVGETSGGVGGEYFVYGVKEGDGTVIDGVVGVAFL